MITYMSLAKNLGEGRSKKVGGVKCFSKSFLQISENPELPLSKILIWRRGYFQPPPPPATPHTHTKVMYDCQANLIYWMFSNYITGRQLLRVKRILSSHCWNLVRKKNIKTWKFAILDKEKPKRTKKRKLESNEEKYRSVFPSSTLKRFDLLCFNKIKIW